MGKERQVPMSDRLRAALKLHHAKPHGKPVLAREDGSDLTSDDVRHGLARVAKYPASRSMAGMRYGTASARG